MSVIKLDYDLLVIIFWMFYEIWILNEEWVSKANIKSSTHFWDEPSLIYVY